MSLYKKQPLRLKIELLKMAINGYLQWCSRVITNFSTKLR